MDNIFYRTLLNDNIKIEPKYLSKDYRKYVLSKLKSKLEGICSRHGFIKTGSIELYKVTPGNIELVGLNGNIVFDVHYYADVCNPLIGNIVKATVTNVNKFGILAEVAGILEIIIAKNSVNIQHDQGVDLDEITIGDTVVIEVLGKKFELNDKKISIVGRIVPSTAKAVTKKAKEKEDIKQVAGGDDDGEDVEDGVVDIVGVGGAEAGEDGDAEAEDSDEDDADDGVVDDEEEELHKDSNGFFESDDEEFNDEEYQFYSDDEAYDEDGVDDNDDI